MATTVSQVAVGNTGNKATSNSSTPGSSSVRTQSSMTSLGQPGMPGNPGQSSGGGGNNNGVQAQVTPGSNPISYAGGQGPAPAANSSLPSIDQNLISSYVDQFRSGALDPQAFTSQLREYLGNYRNNITGAVKGKVDQARANAQSATTVRSPTNRATAPTQPISRSSSSSTPTTGAGSDLSDAEQWLIDRESGGDPSAYNPVQTDTGNAFGIGQLTTANRQKYASQLGVDADTTDYNAQLQMMRMYVQERYGTPEAAVEFWRQNGWY